MQLCILTVQLTLTDLHYISNHTGVIVYMSQKVHYCIEKKYIYLKPLKKIPIYSKYTIRCYIGNIGMAKKIFNFYYLLSTGYYKLRVVRTKHLNMKEIAFVLCVTLTRGGPLI